MFRLSELAQWLSMPCPDNELECSGISIDSRTCSPGQLFIAINGQRVDGHAYVNEAQDKGAVALCVSRPVKSDLPQLVVLNTTKALISLARAYRQTWTKHVIGVTGSYGKTSTKQMIASCLKSHTPHVGLSPGNWNNLYGLCLSILQVDRSDKYAVLEMGANQPGDIAILSEIARPDIAVVTGIAAVHIEKLMSIEGVKKEKLSLFDDVSKHRGRCAVNVMDSHIAQWFERNNPFKAVTYGDNSSCDIWFDKVSCTQKGVMFNLHVQEKVSSVNMELEGPMAIQNAVAAAAVCSMLGLSIETIKAGLSRMKPVPGRFDRIPGPIGSWIYDDSYNANPHALMAAIDYLCNQYSRVVVVLGDMLELGSDAEQIHYEVGTFLKKKKVHALYVTGSLGLSVIKGFGGGGLINSPNKIAVAIQSVVRKGDAIYIKGSRASALERVVNVLRQGVY
jgi:UDP-N-acetylmuramoyl-tripeptide--D-alanyl-D-alanine ligase